MIPGMTLSAVICSAGLSSRMHQFKPLLKFGKFTMLEVVIRLFQSYGIQDILVVTGHNHLLLEPIIQKSGVKSVFNPDFKTGMLGSIQKGAVKVSPESCGFFLLPVDIPAIRISTIHTLVSAFEKDRENIVIPTFNQTPGHPPLIPARLIPEIIGINSDSNLGELLLSQKRRIHTSVHDRGILLDADTKPAYETLAEKYQQLNIPDTEECWSIIESVLPGETALHSHLAMVATVALKLSRALETNSNSQKRICLNKALIQAAALLHDIKRKEKNHADAASQFLNTQGFPRVAKIVAEHMTISLGDQITEKEIVYFADKICNGDQVKLDYAQRFTDKIKKLPKAKNQILKRYEATQKIQSLIEAAVGKPLRFMFQNR